jgi:hypothetical protein
MVESDVDLIAGYETPAYGIHSLAYKQIQKDAWVEWIINKPWKAMITLTYNDDKHQFDITSRAANNDFRRLVQKLNIGVFGDHYTKHCHHSYFGYVLGLEYQKRSVIHYHCLVDNFVNFELIHRYWGNLHGFVWTSIVDDPDKVVDYVSKYITKSGNGNLDPYFSKKNTVPKYKPDWWIKAETAFEQRGFTGESHR